MPVKKRARDEAEPSKRPKKPKFSDTGPNSASKLVSEEIDFPRGGGSTFTPLEYKNIRAEAIQEADVELVFEDSQTKKRTKSNRPPHKANVNTSKHKIVSDNKKDSIRVEHLNYKRLVEGMKVLGQVIAIQPLALIVSLPCQLAGHIPITHISTQLTKQLEAMDREEDSTEEDDEHLLRKVPELFEIFHVGQYVRTVVTAVRLAGTTSRDVIGMRRNLDETERACQRVELSLIPGQVNTGVSKQDLTAGFVLPGAVQSVEDHGYILDMGVSSVTGFLSFQDAQIAQLPEKLPVGYVLDLCVSKMSQNGRTCAVAVDPKMIASSCLSQITTVNSILPGTLVHALITAVLPTGLNVQLLGFFEGTIDLFHLPSGEITTRYKVGQKIKARVLWDMITSGSRRFALSLLLHTLDLDVSRTKNNQALQDAFPVGTTLEAVKVVRVEAERGVVLDVHDGVLGYVHIRHISDDHVPSLSPNSGHWKLGTIHRARVIGFQALDGILQLSLQESVLAQKFLQVADVEVGEHLKATVKRLTSAGLFVSISGNVDGVIWPNHYADISLKHPQKRFREGSILKCRVLVVDPDRKRIALTAKKTLVESELPILTRLEDAKIGLVTHAVVFKVLEKALLVEFYNNLCAQIPSQEACETPLPSLSNAFPIGKPVKVRITSIIPNSRRIFASILQASTAAKDTEVADVHGAQVGDSVNGTIHAIHKDQVVLKLQPSGTTALLSIKNLANNRETTIAQLRAALTIGEQLDGLTVMSRNTEKGLVIVSKRPKPNVQPNLSSRNEGFTAKAVEVGDVLSGRVTGYGRGGSTLHITNALKVSLHPTDSCDDYSAGTPFPSVESVIEGVVVRVDESRKYVALSTRPSRLRPTEKIVPRDPEISNVEDLKVGDTIRGFIKNIVDHGLFVSLGRTVDARIQIRELFDEYVQDWKPRFEVNQLVQGKITNVNVTANQVEMSLRSRNTGKQTMSFGGLQEGQKVDAIIKKKEKYGVFLEIKDTKISGLCHKSEISDNPKADIDRALLGLREGDPLRAIILSLSLEKQRISFGLKPSYFDDKDFEMHDAEVSSHGDVTHPVAQETKSAEASESEDDAEVDYADPESIRIENMPPPPSHGPDATPRLELQGGFKWTDETHNETHSGRSASDFESESESLSGLAKKSKNRKKKKKIEYDLTGDMHTRQPESTGDFERLLLSSPNSSYIWIQYMAFQFQLSEIDKAREVGKRALRTINFREEQEKMNVWIALLNLENKYGTDESLEDVFKDAARHNDSKTIHLRLASVFDATERYDRAAEQYQRTCKKFGKSSKVWTLFGEHYLKRGDLEAARLLLPRSLQCLEKRKHLKTISKFAQLEYKLGDPERGRTLFEGIVSSHPKRWDIWSVYVDMESTKQRISAIRNIFDRVLALKMTSHKAKAFFKKWLVLEKSLGDEDGENTVKAKAIEWTRMATAGPIT